MSVSRTPSSPSSPSPFPPLDARLLFCAGMDVVAIAISCQCPLMCQAIQLLSPPFRPPTCQANQLSSPLCSTRLHHPDVGLVAVALTCQANQLSSPQSRPLTCQASQLSLPFSSSRLRHPNLNLIDIALTCRKASCLLTFQIVPIIVAIVRRVSRLVAL